MFTLNIVGVQRRKSLYERLGGYDSIAAFVVEWVALQRADPRFARFSGGRGTDKKMRDVQLNIDAFCQATGGSNYYMGRDLKQAHMGLNINNEEWAASVKYMEEAMVKCGIREAERKEFLELMETMRDDIVENHS